MKAYLYPGQGSQAIGMGGYLFDKYPDTVELTDAILGYSIRELCLQDPENKLSLTQYTQPAIYVVNALHHLAHSEDPDTCAPNFLMGHSLGEYNALLAAGVIDFSTGLQLVKHRGEIMGMANGGAMAAIMGLTLTAVSDTLKDNQFNSIDVANINTQTQIVIAGKPADIKRALPIFDEKGGKAIPLKVSAAFHSRQMEGAAREFSLVLDNFQFRTPRIPVISNVTAKPHQTHAIRQLLSIQLRHQVRWLDSVRYLQSQNVQTFTEVGSGRVLTRMLKKIHREDRQLSKAA
jgi:malonyl CoA-acyl carrier protein transacylase